MFQLHQNGVFFSAASCKKHTIFDAARKIFGPSYFVMALAFLQTGIRKEVRLQRRSSRLEFRIETLLERINYNEAINLPIGLLPRNPHISRDKWDNKLQKKSSNTLKFCTPIPLEMPQANMSSNSLQRRYILSYYLLLSTLEKGHLLFSPTLISLNALLKPCLTAQYCTHQVGNYVIDPHWLIPRGQV